ncbi:hypothetical protein FJN17_01055 [Bradyrhizobium symbiodeficiens]|uniref:Uncharacterized protein n=1 Tax=Bradyrhizobium symbiodeficiens TaxID=1404367 RepID=A0ABX5W209_9BRAD|nr:hypothetical protein [Bradyrhizobium symbiodeficiens]QDF36260.1 hypothetical protein FJN17_01055 [Bradyrhizobium symbiodeficiens]
MVVSTEAIKLISLASYMVAVGLTLSACASGPLPDRPIAWDGAGRDPNLPEVHKRRRHVAAVSPKQDQTAEEDALLASLEPRSAEWFAAQRKIDADRDKRLAAKLIICRGCSVSTTKAEPSQVTAGSTESRLSALR